MDHLINHLPHLFSVSSAMYAGYRKLFVLGTTLYWATTAGWNRRYKHRLIQKYREISLCNTYKSCLAPASTWFKLLWPFDPFLEKFLWLIWLNFDLSRVTSYQSLVRQVIANRRVGVYTLIRKLMSLSYQLVAQTCHCLPSLWFVGLCSLVQQTVWILVWKEALISWKEMVFSWILLTQQLVVQTCPCLPDQIFPNLPKCKWLTKIWVGRIFPELYVCLIFGY